ncbi:hypothetical protein E2C01_018279 [Portunus trituberculatus]|uniref:Uncharacterized protein n=1 Tax=Portunus trituberculatus TaxID=210409 RepID=A0A5B7DW08_PORTR|nr:hypothetical protein [Portunus trituberculatus]
MERSKRQVTRQARCGNEHETMTTTQQTPPPRWRPLRPSPSPMTSHVLELRRRVGGRQHVGGEATDVEGKGKD